MRTRSAALAVVLAAFAAAPGAADAQSVTLAADRACYGPGQLISLAGDGFTPDGDVVLSVDGQQVGIGIADYGGLFSTSLRAPSIPVAALTFTATDRAQLAKRASASVRLTSLGVAVTPRTGDPTRPRRIRARGFFDGGVLYAHVRRRGRTRTMRLGILTDPCGTLDVRRRLFPPGVDAGRYTLRFDTSAGGFPRGGRSVVYAVTISSTGRGAATGSRERWRRVAP